MELSSTYVKTHKCDTLYCVVTVTYLMSICVVVPTDSVCIPSRFSLFLVVFSPVFGRYNNF